jgi:hypothetical protein
MILVRRLFDFNFDRAFNGTSPLETPALFSRNIFNVY